MEHFRDARHTARMTIQDVADYLCISVSTVKRYDKTGKAPKAVIECLRMIGGEFPAIARGRNNFNRWSFGQGYLWSPGGERFTSGDILASRLDAQLVETLHRSNLKLRQEKEMLANVESARVIPFPVKNRCSDMIA